MRNFKLGLGGLVLVLAGSANAFAQAAPADNNKEETTEACPMPNQPAGAPAQSCPTPQQPQAAEPAPQPAPAPMETEYGTQDWTQRYGLAFSIGGGVDDFVGTSARNQTGVGGSWTARVTLGTRSYLAGEISYIGSAQTIQAIGLNTNTDLIGNGAQAALRLNATEHYGVQPFLYGGAAWRHYSLNTSSANLSDISNSTDAFEVPAGIGVAGYFDGFMLDVRGEYRFAWTDHALFIEPDGGQALADRWGVTGNLGYSF